MVVAAVLLVAVASHCLQAGGDDVRQTELRELDTRSLATFKKDFNRASFSVRVVLLLSPT
jgi:hypothetical protein